MKQIILILLVLSLFTVGFARDEARLMRFPHITDNLIAFVYAGDIWTVGADGGTARRLTSHEGLELFPKISPDGQWIAFSAEYSGSRQVYIMPSQGGLPQQMTYYNDVGYMPPRGGFDYVVLDWTPDSQNVLVRANRTPWGEREGKYFLVNIKGGLETPLQIPEGGFGSFSPDGKQICYTPIGREFRTWKRYKGGRAADVWVYDLEKDTSKQLTTFVGSDQIPSWYGDKIYFASDRELTLNIFAYDLKTDETEQLTHHTEFDVMWPAGDKNLLVYENGGYLYKLDLDSKKETKLTIYLDYDNASTLPYFKNVTDNIYSMAISPTGKRVLFDARGDIFSVPAKEGQIENLTGSQGVREISPTWSPDGKYIVYYSDLSGEYEIYLQDAEKKNKAEQITTGSSSWKNQAVWSPDSKKLLFSDKKQNLQILDINTRAITMVDRANQNDILDYQWAPDSQWVAYSKQAPSNLNVIWIYSLKDKTPRQLTNASFGDRNPVFSTNGEYLYFLSDRDFNLSFSSFEFTYLYNKSTKVYAMALKKSATPLFVDKNDKEEPVKPDVTKTDKEKSAEKKKTETVIAPVQVDFDGINNRVYTLPIEADNYGFLGVVKDGLLYVRGTKLYRYDIEKKKEETILEAVDNVTLAADGHIALYVSGKDYSIIDLDAVAKPEITKLNLDNLEMKIEPRKEWQQIYKDGCRIFRDWFYVSNLHGLDWKKMGQRYTPLVSHVNHRADLDYIFGELLGESNTGHTYVNWGDVPKVKRMDTGLLGAELKADKKAGRYIISKIYTGENWDPARRSPLTEQGIDIQEGVYLIGLNNHDVTLADNPYRFLENTVNKPISIVVNSKPVAEGARTFTIKPIASELSLFYIDWVASRRAYVDKLSGGKIGYIHVPDTLFDGNKELFKGIYAYQNKEALIIDDRNNGGGFIPEIMVELLGRTTLNYWARRDLEPMRSPGIVHDGPKAMLINHYSSSGGDAFPYYFRKRNLGVLIGTRTWGGLVGIQNNASFADGGSFNVPTFGFYDTDGNWAVEGEGISPDIKVVDEPHLLVKGQDPCIEKAVEVLLKQLQEKPVKKVSQPADPDRSKWIEKEIK